MASRLRSVLTICSLVLLAAAPATQPVRDLTATSLNGEPRRLLDVPAETKAVVLFFVATDCPISNGYVPEINRLADAYTPRGVALYTVYSGTDITLESASAHAKAYALHCGGVIDPTCAVANAVGANVTLECAVLLPDGSLIYRGRLDDLNPALGKKRFAATSHDVQDVLDAVLRGDKVEPRFTQAVGCSILKPEAAGR